MALGELTRSALSHVRSDAMGDGFTGSSPMAIRADMVELSRGQYSALVELTTALGRMVRTESLPEELKQPFRQVLTAFGV
jgi:hypothetical protein